MGHAGWEPFGYPGMGHAGWEPFGYPGMGKAGWESISGGADPIGLVQLVRSALAQTESLVGSPFDPP